MKRSLRVVAAVLIVATGICFVLAVWSIQLSDKNAAGRDFISYWATGQLLVKGQNPYNFDAVRKLELGAGRGPAEPILMMRNPPTAFWITLPLGFAGPKASLIGWLGFLMGVLSVSVWLVWRLNGSPDDRFHLLGYVFAPALSCIMAGQFGIIMLFGILVFLYLHNTRPLLAGAALSLCALKPHYFLPFGVALLLWVVKNKSYRVLAGFGAAALASCAVANMLDPHAWGHYAQMMQAGGALNESIPELSAQLRFLIAPHAVWVQFVPEIMACLWAAGYFWTHRFCWSWTEHGQLVLLVGALSTPFGWFFDECVLFPAIMAGLYQAMKSRRPVWPLFVIFGVALAEAIAGVRVISRCYLWTVPAWLCWYLYATRRFALRPSSDFA